MSLRANFLLPQPDLLELPVNQIDLWLAAVEESCDPALLGRYRLLLSAEEIGRGERFYFAKDRHRHLVTRALLRTVLSRYAPLAPQQWVFANNAHGKPEVANAEPLAQGLSFNLSHTRGLIVLGVRRGGALGVDVEHLHARRALLDAGNAVFSDAERDALALLSGDEQQQRFFQYWTLKEAYLKASGTGMSVALRNVSFEFLTQERVRLSLHGSLQGPASRWHFWQFRPTPDHLLSVCAEQGAAQHCVARTVVPLGPEELLDCEPFLQSMP